MGAGAGAGRRRTGRAAAGALLAALVVVLGGAGVVPALAAGPAAGGPTAVGEVPPQVRAAYDGELLRAMVTSTEGGAGPVRAGTVHQLFSFTEEFTAGGASADPVQAQQGWIAGVEAGGVPVGWQRTHLDDAGQVRSSGWNPDPEGARAFLGTTAGALVEVPWDGAFFTLVDGVVTPVRVSSWDAGLGPRSLAQVQEDFAAARAETEAAYAGCRPADGCAGGGGAPAGGGGAPLGAPRAQGLAVAGLAVVVLGAGGLTLVHRRVRQRP
ncbi:hypothetical protein [Quadrisphaera sp. KR29]|uniref:hypothetical protein n=1 Tax=Quadrisphaera sp. KR29 TaxID=3461391 RepID=UPI004043DA3B